MDSNPNKQAILDRFSELGISYEYFEHGPAYTMEDCANYDRQFGLDSSVAHCKNLFLTNRQKTDFYLLVLAGDKPYRTGDFCRALGVSRLSFGPAEELKHFLHLEPGAVNPLSLLFDTEKRVQLVCDAAMRTSSALVFHPGENTSSVKMDPRDFFERYLPSLGVVPVMMDVEQWKVVD